MLSQSNQSAYDDLKNIAIAEQLQEDEPPINRDEL
jgi:hypothetical protein